MLKSPLVQTLTRIVLTGFGLTCIAAIVYLGGPYVVIGGWRPLENPIVRESIVAVLIVAVGAFAGFGFWKRRRDAAALTQAVAEGGVEDDSAELEARMKDALATLKAANGGRSDFLYSLPWYVIIGPPGSGKTTALVNSELRFPLAGGSKPSAIAGVGGTRYCDWWFTEDAVLVDTAGRYVTQDSDAQADKQSWLAFLDLLKKSRPRQPINGVIVAISLEDLLTLSEAERDAHARAIRARLVELHDRLKITFPVYVLFTKADLVAGFMEYFGHLGDQGRRQVWGATFQTNDKTRNMVGEVPQEFDRLVERLNDEMPDRLQEEPTPGTRVALFGFPAQLAALKRNVHGFLNAIFEPTRYHASAILRGFYFSSGTQNGTPIDQLINALVKNFGAQEARGIAYSGAGKSFFLTNLIQKVIIGEAAWVSTDPKAARRAFALRVATLIGVATAALAFAGALYVSYSRNGELVAASQDAAREYAVTAGPLASADEVADRDFGKILPLLQKLRVMPAGFNQQDASTPLAMTFGLSQKERLSSSQMTAYRLGLERLLRPRLLYRLEEVIAQKQNDPGAVYEALKAYMMLGGKAQLDPDLVKNWVMRDWELNLYPGAANADGRKVMEQHLTALLQLEGAGDPLVEPSAEVVKSAQNALARLNVAQRAYEIMKSEIKAKGIPDWSAASAGGLDFDRLFEVAAGFGASDGVVIPGFYTYRGFHEGFLDELPGIAERVNRDKWVLGDFADQSGVTEQYKNLPQALLDLYSADFVETWRAALGRLRMKKLTTDKPRYETLNILSAPTSPLRQLFESIARETALTRERPKPANAEAKKPDAPAQPNLFPDQDPPPGTRVEQAFRPYQQWIAPVGTKQPQIDDLLEDLALIKDNLITSARSPAQSGQTNAELQNQVLKFRSLAERLPDPFKIMLVQASGAFENDVNQAQLSGLSQGLKDQVTGPCLQAVNGRYPFSKGAGPEISLQDFGRLFAPAPTGAIDQFFKQSLAKYADTSKKDWTWRTSEPLARSFSPATLKEFQRAAKIRDVFFSSSSGPLPGLSFAVYPPLLSGFGVNAKLEVNGASVVSQAGTAVSPQPMLWPGPNPVGRAAVILGSDLPGFAPAVLDRAGPWSLFRLIDSGAPTIRPDGVSVSFLVGGRELLYRFFAGPPNPFALPELREFRCPTGI